LWAAGMRVALPPLIRPSPATKLQRIRMKPVAAPLSPLRDALAACLAFARLWKLVLVVLLVAVSYLALTPRPPAGIDLGWDKLNHMAAFTALAFCAALGFRTTRRTLLAASGGLLVFGGLIEILQLTVPGRSSEWGDLLADAIGIAVGMAIAGALGWWVSHGSRAIR